MADKCPAAFKTERARIEAERRLVEADLGPVRYLAALPYFIVAVALALRPAVLLLPAATRRAQP